ncbi:MAG: response regulator transcription factor [Deltaproteobacteria bacterium]|nr:response regulator transcription factor [Deltaproteobacteria bacterium]
MPAETEARRIVVIEDEPDLARALEFNLRAAGFEVHLASTGREGLRLASLLAPALVTLDLMLPDLAGTDVCRALRAAPATRAVPIIVVSARADEIDRVVLFELGVDDYVAKPFSTRELVLRVLALLRRTSVPPPAPSALRLGLLELDPSGHRARVEGRLVALTLIEFRLLHALTSAEGEVRTREQLAADVWQGRMPAGSRTIDTHIKGLRQKLGPAGVYIRTLRGVGYRFAV